MMAARFAPARGTDEQLAARAGAGDDAAFTAIVGRYRARLVRYAGRLLAGTGADPEDVVQDSLLAMLRALRTGARPENFGGWIHVIVRNACVDAAARHARASAATRGSADAPPAGQSAYDAAAQRESLEALVRDIGALRPSQRRAVLGREFEGRSYRQLAEDQTTSVSAIKSLLVRARAALRDRAEGGPMTVILVARPLRRLLAPAICAGAAVAGAIAMAPLTVPVPVSPPFPPRHLIDEAIRPATPLPKRPTAREALAGAEAAAADCPGNADALVYEYEYTPVSGDPAC